MTMALRKKRKKIKQSMEILKNKTIKQSNSKFSLNQKMKDKIKGKRNTKTKRNKNKIIRWKKQILSLNKKVIDKAKNKNHSKINKNNGNHRVNKNHKAQNKDKKQVKIRLKK